MIIVDTGFWVGLANQRDQNHVQCQSFLKHCKEPLITTDPVLVETIHLLFRRIGVSMTLAWFDTLLIQGFELFALDARDLPRIQRLMHQYADLPMDLADASLVLLAEALGHGRIVSTDQRDFNTYRWKNHHPFQNLLDDDSLNH